MEGATAAAPTPPEAQRSPVARPSFCLNQPLTDASRGTMAKDWVTDSITPKYKRNCQKWVTVPIKIMLVA